MIGAAFYIMSMEEGRVFCDSDAVEGQTGGSAAPDLRPARSRTSTDCMSIRSSVIDRDSATSASRVIISRARSIALDQAIPRLSGKRSTFRKSKRLIEWLPKNRAGAGARCLDRARRLSCFDNMIFHPDRAAKVQGGARLGTDRSLGDPMADFTYLLMQWVMPGARPEGGSMGLGGADLKTLNIPTMDEAAQIYCNVTGSAVPDLNWYFSYNLFRLACITQGIAGRIRDGTAASAKAMESAKRTVPLAKASWEYAQKAGAVRRMPKFVSRTRSSVLHDAPQSRDPQFSRKWEDGPRISSAPRREVRARCAASGARARPIKSASPHTASTPSTRRRPGSPGR